MEKKRILQILEDLTKNKYPMNNLDREDYSYLENENEVVYFSHVSTTDEVIVRMKQVIDKMAEDLLGNGNEYERFIMIIEYNRANEMLMVEMASIYHFIELCIKDKKLIWGLSENNDINHLRFTIIASK